MNNYSKPRGILSQYSLSAHSTQPVPITLWALVICSMNVHLSNLLFLLHSTITVYIVNSVITYHFSNHRNTLEYYIHIYNQGIKRFDWLKFYPLYIPFSSTVSMPTRSIGLMQGIITAAHYNRIMWPSSKYFNYWTATHLSP